MLRLLFLWIGAKFTGAERAASAPQWKPLVAEQQALEGSRTRDSRCSPLSPERTLPLVRFGPILICLLGGFAAHADSTVSARFATAKISVEQWRAYLAEVKAMPDAHCQEEAAKQYVCDSSEQRTVWVFTREGHLAHPAVTRGIMVSRQTAEGERVSVDRTGHYAGDPLAFAAWMKQFKILDKNQVAEWERLLQLK